MMKTKYSLLSILIMTSYQTAAAQPWHPLTHNDPNVITVTEPASSPLLVTTSPKTPRQPVPASDGADYLKTIPGFSSVRNGGTNGDPVFRGMADSRLRILTNGAEMLGACPNRMDAPTSYISPEEFDKLTVIKGPETVLWGPGNSAGTVLFTREPPTFDKAGVQGTVTALGGSNDRYDGNADLSVGNSLGYLRLLGSKSHASDYTDGDGHKVHSYWDKWGSDVELGFTPDDNKLFEMTAGTGNGKAAYAGRDMDGVEFLRKSLGFKFELDNLSETFNKLEGQINYNYAYHVMDNYTLRPLKQGKPPHIMPFDRRTVAERFMGTWQWTAVKLEAGLDGETYTHRDIKMYNPLTDVRGGFTKDARYEDYGLFGQLSWDITDTNKLIGGARIDYTNMVDSKNADRKRSATMPAGFMRLEHHFADAPAMLYAGVGYVERFPDYWELFSNDNNNSKATYKGVALSVPSDPFASLKPERTAQLDIGAQYKGEALTAWVSGYAGYIDDFILFKFGKKPGMMMGGMHGMMMGDMHGMMMKSAKAVGNINARIMGAEAGVGYKITDHWKTDASLAYSYGQNLTEDQPLPQMPPLEARFSTTYEQNGLSGTLLWRVVSKQNRVALNEGNLVGQDLASSAGFGILSANLAWKFNKYVQISVGVDNLFNKLYSEHLNKAGAGIPGYVTDDLEVTEPGRTYWGKLNVTF